MSLLRNHAATVYAERLERLLSAAWEPALAGDFRATELAPRILDQQAKFYRPKDRMSVSREASDADEHENELESYRQRHGQQEKT